jgi:hypothetical protein
MMDCLILGKTALIYSVVTIYLGLRPRIKEVPGCSFGQIYHFDYNSPNDTANQNPVQCAPAPPLTTALLLYMFAQ